MKSPRERRGNLSIRTHYSWHCLSNRFLPKCVCSQDLSHLFEGETQQHSLWHVLRGVLERSFWRRLSSHHHPSLCILLPNSSSHLDFLYLSPSFRSLCVYVISYSFISLQSNSSRQTIFFSFSSSQSDWPSRLPALLPKVSFMTLTSLIVF